MSATEMPAVPTAGIDRGSRDGSEDRVSLLAPLMIALTFVTGMTDAIGYTKLGGVFTSVMTGNMVLLGVAAGQRSVSIVWHVVAAFAGYVAGTVAGARVAGRSRRPGDVWPVSVTRALVLELGAFVVFAAWWEADGCSPSDHVAIVLLSLNAFALGIQGSAVIRLNISGLSTTYLTGTLTTVLVSITSREPSVIRMRSVGILVSLIAGAAVGAVLAISAPRLAPLAMLAVLASVIVAATRLSRSGPV